MKLQTRVGMERTSRQGVRVDIKGSTYLSIFEVKSQAQASL